MAEGDILTIGSGGDQEFAQPATALIYVQDADPGAVGARNLWLQTNVEAIAADAVQLWVRNAADTGWIGAGSVVQAGADFVNFFSPNNIMSLSMAEGVNLKLRDASANGSELIFQPTSAGLYAGTGLPLQLGSDTGNFTLEITGAGALEFNGDPIGTQAAAVADLAIVVSDPPEQTEVQEIADKVDALLAALRASNELAT